MIKTLLSFSKCIRHSINPIKQILMEEKSTKQELYMFLSPNVQYFSGCINVAHSLTLNDQISL